MSDVRCPMCGKPNPAEAEVCEYCQARLKPLNLGSAAQPGTEPEVPNWLTSLRGTGQDQEESDGQSEPAPDWLTGLRSETSIPMKPRKPKLNRLIIPVLLQTRTARFPIG